LQEVPLTGEYSKELKGRKQNPAKILQEHLKAYIYIPPFNHGKHGVHGKNTSSDFSEYSVFSVVRYLRGWFLVLLRKIVGLDNEVFL
jgi:hypothetical protein